MIQCPKKKHKNSNNLCFFQSLFIIHSLSSPLRLLSYPQIYKFLMISTSLFPAYSVLALALSFQFHFCVTLSLSFNNGQSRKILHVRGPPAQNFIYPALYATILITHIHSTSLLLLLVSLGAYSGSGLYFFFICKKTHTLSFFLLVDTLSLLAA